MQISDLPEYLQKDVAKALNESPKMKSLRDRVSDAIRKGDYVRAAELRKFMARIEDDVIQKLLRANKSMKDMYNEMSAEDIYLTKVACNTIIMLADIIESEVMDLNQTVHKYDSTHKIYMYDKFVELGKEAKAQMKYMSECTNEAYQVAFGDYSDDLRELIHNKVKSLLRKLDA